MPQGKSKTRNAKVLLIIDSALEILRSQGEPGLAMRQVAAKAGMSLGNLQYYFKNKDELLIGLGDVYSERCAAEFYRSLLNQKPEGKREIIAFLVDYCLRYSESEVCKVFRELWSISAKNESIKKRLHDYYGSYANGLAEMLAPFAKTPACTSRAVSLLIPYFDGLGLISFPFPSSKREMADYLAEIIDSTLAGELAAPRP